MVCNLVLGTTDETLSNSCILTFNLASVIKIWEKAVWSFLLHARAIMVEVNNSVLSWWVWTSVSHWLWWECMNNNPTVAFLHYVSVVASWKVLCNHFLLCARAIMVGTWIWCHQLSELANYATVVLSLQLWSSKWLNLKFEAYVTFLQPITIQTMVLWTLTLNGWLLSMFIL